ncbi:MAG: folylpolyglutamate synthase/dihydrofolate synthase family protein [Candidatus Binatia bacterium]
MPTAYQQTLADLYALEAKKGMDFRLERLDPVLEALGHPESAFTCVHLAGTNGKGSTSAMIASALVEGGYRTGLYTSPHLVSFRERIRVDGVAIARAAVVDRVAAVRDAEAACGANLTFFEIATLAAFLEFRERGVRVAVLEAGLGGRLDVTNVARGDVAVITSVGIDHAEFLGHTLAEVAREKAAIIKEGSTAVTGALHPEAEAVVAERVAAVGAKRLAWGRDFTAYAPMEQAQARRPGGVLAGVHQAHNAALAAAAVGALSAMHPARFPTTSAAVEKGILGVRWPGRLEVLRRRRGDGPLVMDAAHNPEAASVLADALDTVAPSHPRVLVFAAMGDKDWPSMLAALAPRFDRVFFAPLPIPRAADPALFLEAVPGGTVATSALEALELADEAASAHGSVVVTGSIFLLGHLYRPAGGALLEDDLID